MSRPLRFIPELDKLLSPVEEVEVNRRVQHNCFCVIQWWLHGSDTRDDSTTVAGILTKQNLVMQEIRYSPLTMLLSLVGVLLISSGTWIFLEGPNFHRSATPAPVQLLTNNDEQEAVTSQSAAASITSRLTAREWVFADRGLRTEGFRLIFSSNGHFTRKVISDYSETRSGVWAYKEIGPGSGLLFMYTTANSSAAPNSDGSEEVFRLRLTNESLLLGRYSLRPDAKISERTHQVQSPSTNAVINDKNFPTYFRLTGRHWIRSEMKDSAFMPDSLTLQGDGTFRASYRKEECRHDGYWSLERSQIFLELPDHHCDTRGYRNPVIRGHYYGFEDGYLILDRAYRYSASQ